MQALRTFETILQFRQGDVRLAANLLPEPLMHGRSDSVRSSSPPPWSVDLAGLSSPCRNLLGPTHTDPELLRDFLQRPFAGVISLKELSPQIIRVSLWHRDRAENRHPAAYLRPPVYEFTEKALGLPRRPEGCEARARHARFREIFRIALFAKVLKNR